MAVGTQPIPYRQACTVPLLLDLNSQPPSLFTVKGTKVTDGPSETGGSAQVVDILKSDRGGVFHKRRLGIESAERPADSDG